MENKTNLFKAIIAVMAEVKGVEKNMDVGSGKNTYKGVADKDVKQVIGEAMEKHGLAILPIEIVPKIQIDRWEEKTDYGLKQKQSVLTEVSTKYLLVHESGENIEIAGYGHGIDTQDKSAGKATTYALKNTLLYTFLVPTGKIDDTDNEHSDNHSVPGSNTSALPPNRPATTSKYKSSINPPLTQDEAYMKAEKAIIDEEDKDRLESFKKFVDDHKILSEEQKKSLNEMIVNRLSGEPF